MTDPNPQFKKLEKRLEGQPFVAGQYTIQPVAQVSGGYLTVTGETGQGGGALLRITPQEVIVSKGQEEPYPISLENETDVAMKGIAQAGLFIAAICWFGIIVANILRLFKEMK